MGVISGLPLHIDLHHIIFNPYIIPFPGHLNSLILESLLLVHLLDVVSERQFELWMGVKLLNLVVVVVLNDEKHFVPF